MSITNCRSGISTKEKQKSWARRLPQWRNYCCVSHKIVLNNNRAWSSKRTGKNIAISTEKKFDRFASSLLLRRFPQLRYYYCGPIEIWIGNYRPETQHKSEQNIVDATPSSMTLPLLLRLDWNINCQLPFRDQHKKRTKYRGRDAFLNDATVTTAARLKCQLPITVPGSAHKTSKI